MRRRRGALALLLCLAAGGAAAQLDRAERRVIFQQRSLYRNVLVIEGGGRRCMTFGRYHGEQTCVLSADPDRMVLSYTRALLAAFYARPQPRRVLVVGLGGGVLPRAVRRLYPDADIDSVELDPAVAAVARSHFGFAPDARSRVFIDDGRVFVRKQRRAGARYDVVLVDAFEKDYIPEHMLSREFLAELKGVLAPHGVVAANTFSHRRLSPHESATYQAVFGPLYQLEMDSGNRILLAGRDGLPALAELRANAARLAPALAPLGVDAPDLAARIGATAPETAARVLTDQFSPANLLLR